MHPALRHYYYYSSSSDPSQTLADAFNARVVADSGTYESDSCLVDQISTLRTMGFWDDATFVLTPNGYKLNKLYAVKPTDASGDLTLTRVSPKPRINSSAAREILAAGMPAIDYTGGGCPAILLEKAGPNLITQQDDFSHASWVKGATTVTANAVNAPDGTLTADFLKETITNAGHWLEWTITKAATPVQYTITICAKPNGRDWIRIGMYEGANSVYKYFNVSTGALGSTIGTGFTLNNARMDLTADGFYRCEVTITTTAATSVKVYIQIANADGAGAYAGDTTKGLYLHRARVEASSYATTSYPDTITAKSAQALIGQTEGTIVFRASATADSTGKSIAISDNTSANRVLLSFDANNKLQGFIARASVTQANIVTAYSFVTDQVYNLAIVYKDGYAALFVDGVKIDEDVAVTVPACTHITLHNGEATPAAPFYGRLKQYSLLDRALTFEETVERTLPDGEEANSQVLVDAASHCWFARDKAVYHAGSNKTFFSQVHHNEDGVYSQYIFQLDHATNEVTKFRLGTVEQHDDHNEPSILIRASDSKLFVAYTEHSASVIRYRISENALDISAWGAEQTVDPNATSLFTYPSCFEDASGDIFIFFRDALGGTVSTWSYIKSTDAGATFGGYTNYSDYTYSNASQHPSNKDLIHFVVSEHPGDADDPNTIGHFYFNCATATFYKSDGTNITANIPLDRSDVTIIQSNALPVQCWIEDIIVDSTGKPRVLFFVIQDETLLTTLVKDEYYSEWNGSAWTTPELLHSSSKNMETDGTLESKWYAPLGAFDRGNPDRIFSSQVVSGVCEIFKLTRVAADNFSSEQMTSGSTYDQWRPFTTSAPTKNVFWLNKVRYKHWIDDYYQQLMCDTF